MKASSVTKINNLLNMGKPKSLHEDRSHIPDAGYVTPDHIACVRCYRRDITGTETVHFEYSDTSGVYALVKGFPATRFNRKYLIEMLTNMDCDNVLIGFEFEKPLYLGGMIEDVIAVEGVIAPIIGDDEQ